jgi:hypothetical protein
MKGAKQRSVQHKRVPGRATPSKKRPGLRERGRVARRKTAKLPQTARTKTEERMYERLQTLERGSLRYRVLSSAIEFKRSWVDLAEHLTEVAKSGGFKEWGYRTFEAYAQHELHLKRDTAQKLTRSFDFLASHEPGYLEEARAGNGDGAELPHYQALDVLAEARSNPYLAEKDYREIRDQVFGEDLSPSQVKKMVRDRAPEPLKEKRDNDPEDRLRKCLYLAERLYGLLLEIEDLPERIAQAVEEAVGGLRRALEE